MLISSRILLLIVLVTVGWGYTWVMMKLALEFMGPYTFNMLRFGFGSLTMLLVLLVLKVPRPKRQDLPALAILGLLQTTGVFLLTMTGMQFIGAGKAAILVYSMTLWSMLLAHYFLKEKITSRKLAGVMLGLLGLGFVIGIDFFYVWDRAVLLGEALLLLSAFCWGAANVFLKYRFKEANPIQVNTWQLVFGTLGLSLAAIILEWGEPIIMSGTALLTVLFTGIISTAFCFTAWYMILAKVDTTVASVSILFVPLIALVFSWLQLGEALNAGILIGAVLITIGAYLASVTPQN